MSATSFQNSKIPVIDPDATGLSHLRMTAAGGLQTQPNTLMKPTIIIAAIAALGFTACEDKKADVETKAKDEAKKAVDKAADKAKEANTKAADAAKAANEKVDAAAGAAKEKIDAIPSAPSAPKAPKPPTTDEVINSAPDAAPAPAPKPPVPAAPAPAPAPIGDGK